MSLNFGGVHSEPYAPSTRRMIETTQDKAFERAFSSYRESMALAARSVTDDFARFFEDFGGEYSRARLQRISTTPLQVFGLTSRELCHSYAPAGRWYVFMTSNAHTVELPSSRRQPGRLKIRLCDFIHLFDPSRIYRALRRRL